MKYRVYGLFVALCLYTRLLQWLRNVVGPVAME